MVEHGGEQDESKLDFDSAGEAVAYISLEQARVLALQHARDNRDFYGRYAGSGLVWDVIGAEETEDFYEVRLSYLPAGSFRCAGVEQFTIDKTGPIEFRQIVNHPRQSRRRATIFAFAFVVVVAAAAMGGLLATGALTRDGSASLLATVATPTPMPSPAIVPNEIPEQAPQPTEFKIVGIIVPTSPSPGTPRPQNWRLETAVRPEESGSVGMSPPKQEPLYFQGDSVELTANCDSGFVGWEGDVPASSEKTDNPISVIMDKPRILYAFCVEPALAAHSAGAELVFAGEYEAAIEKLNEAIRLAPRYAPAYSSRGSAYLHTGESQAAIQDYDTAIRMAPENPDLADDYYNRGFVYQTIGEYQQAITDFTQAIRLSPVRPDLYESRATVYDNLGEAQKANADRAIACQVDKTFCGAEAPAP